MCLEVKDELEFLFNERENKKLKAELDRYDPEKTPSLTKEANELSVYSKHVAKRLIDQVNLKSTEYIINHSEINRMFEGLNMLFTNSDLSTKDKLKTIYLYALIYLKIVNLQDTHKFEDPKSHEHFICNYNRVIKRLNQGIQLFMLERVKMCYFHGKAEVVQPKINFAGKSNANVDKKSDGESENNKPANPSEILTCSKNCTHGKCEKIIKYYFRIVSMFIVAIENPEKYGLMSLPSDVDAVVYAKSLEKYKKFMFDLFINIRNPKCWIYLEEIVVNKPILF